MRAGSGIHPLQNQRKANSFMNLPVGNKICKLPGGYIDEEGIVHQETELTPLSGREEELLARNMGNGESASQLTIVLSRCVKRIGKIAPVSEKITRNLLIADRQFLLLELKKLTFGNKIQATFFCPWPECGSKMDIDFSINDIPVKESKDKGPSYHMDLSPDAAFTNNGEKKFTEIIFRLPNGGDQEVISPIVHQNEGLAFSMLLNRCIQKIGPYEQPKEEHIYQLSPRARREIEQQMEAVSPKVELTMTATCPECKREFDAPFDLHKFFFGELQTSLNLLYREIHYLAYYYHWSEKEIMEMPREKRYRHIEVLSEEIERMNNEA